MAKDTEVSKENKKFSLEKPDKKGLSRKTGFFVPKKAEVRQEVRQEDKRRSKRRSKVRSEVQDKIRKNRRTENRSKALSRDREKTGKKIRN